MLGAGALVLALTPDLVLAQAMPAITSTPAAGGGTQWSLSIQTLLLITSLSFLPALLLMMTSFTRIIIVFSLMRHALGTQTSPPNQVLVGLALLHSLFLTYENTLRFLEQSAFYGRVANFAGGGLLAGPVRPRAIWGGAMLVVIGVSLAPEGWLRGVGLSHRPLGIVALAVATLAAFGLDGREPLAMLPAVVIVR